MTTLQDKMQNIYRVKREIKNAIGTDSDVFSEYPDMIRSMAGGGVSYSYLDERLSYYVETSDLESMGYATESYVTNAINNIPGIDLSSYVSYTYLESKEYLTEIPNTYATYAAIEAMGYATESYVTNAIENIPGTNIKQDIIPESNGTYTLGDEGYYYAATYSYELKMHLQNSIHIVNPYTIGVKVYDTDRYKFTNEEFAPFNTNVVNVNLGKNNSRFAYTYTNNLILGNDDVRTIFPTYAYVNEAIATIPVVDENIIPKENNTYTLGDASNYYTATYTNSINLTKNTFTNRLYTSGQYSIACEINGGVRYSFMAGSIKPDVSNADLGTSSNKWQNTYTSTLYADNAYTYNNYLGSSKIYHYADNNIYIDYANGKRLIINPNTIYGSSGLNLGTNNLPINNIYMNSTYIHSATYLPTNTYWWNGTSYIWLGSLFT